MKRRIILSALILVALAVSAPLSASATTKAGIKPGSFWYAFDRTFERVSLFFTRDPEKKTQKVLAYANERLVEAEALAEEGKNTDTIRATITDYERNIALAAEKSKEIKDKGKAEGLLASIADSTAKHQETLAVVLGKVPEDAREAVLKAIEASKKGQEEATSQIAELKSEVEQLKKEITELRSKEVKPPEQPTQKEKNSQALEDVKAESQSAKQETEKARLEAEKLKQEVERMKAEAEKQERAKKATEDLQKQAATYQQTQAIQQVQQQTQQNVQNLQQQVTQQTEVIQQQNQTIQQIQQQISQPSADEISPGLTQEERTVLEQERSKKQQIFLEVTQYQIDGCKKTRKEQMANAHFVGLGKNTVEAMTEEQIEAWLREHPKTSQETEYIECITPESTRQKNPQQLQARNRIFEIDRLLKE